MVKQKKDDTGELMVPLEQFTRTRDSVIVSLSNLQTGLTHVQNGLNELLRTYMKHTTSILAGENIAEDLVIPAHITATANAAVEAATSAATAASQAVATPAPAPPPEAGKKKRKREKKERDPNMPKRPLTAAFLYAQVARPIVRRDLEGALAPDQKLEPNAVNLEVTKRWNEMADVDKEKWKASYRDSMEKFKEEMKSYKGSADVNVAELHDDEEASDEAEAGALDSDASSDSEGEATMPTPIAKAPTPPVANTKTPRPNKRQRTAPTPHVNGTLAPVPIAPATTAPSPVPFPVIASARQMTQVLPPASSIEISTPVPGKEKKDKKKKEKTAAVPQPIAPAPAKEPSPDDPKKKPKSSRSTRNTEAEIETPVTAIAEKENKSKKRDRSKRKSENTAT